MIFGVPSRTARTAFGLSLRFLATGYSDMRYIHWWWVYGGLFRNVSQSVWCHTLICVAPIQILWPAGGIISTGWPIYTCVSPIARLQWMPIQQASNVHGELVVGYEMGVSCLFLHDSVNHPEFNRGFLWSLSPCERCREWSRFSWKSRGDRRYAWRLRQCLQLRYNVNYVYSST